MHKADHRTTTTKVVRETEAIAFVVCKAVGLQTGTASAVILAALETKPEIEEQETQDAMAVAS